MNINHRKVSKRFHFSLRHQAIMWHAELKLVKEVFCPDSSIYPISRNFFKSLLQGRLYAQLKHFEAPLIILSDWSRFYFSLLHANVFYFINLELNSSLVRQSRECGAIDVNQGSNTPWFSGTCNLVIFLQSCCKSKRVLRSWRW